jgi:hypothetical protein
VLPTAFTYLASPEALVVKVTLFAACVADELIASAEFPGFDAIVSVSVITAVADGVPVAESLISVSIAVPTATESVVFCALKTNAVAAAFAGTTDKSPNPSEATATADTFFNEIVFTIFLSFSQIKDDLLSGW